MIEITWEIQCRTANGKWEHYHADDTDEQPTESFQLAVDGPENILPNNKDIVEWRLVKTTVEVVRTARRPGVKGADR